MKKSVLGMIKDAFVQPLAFVASCAFVVACTSSNGDGFAGGTSEDAGIIADLNVAGVAQKGPFVKGSDVTVQGIDCKTMKLTGEKFEGKINNDKGEFVVDDVNLSATCALFEVTGYYFNEVTGKKSANKVTLHALSDLSDRKHVNINMLTELEYKRVMNLVSEEKMSFADAKKQAEKEVLASFNVNGDYALSEDLNIFENGDGNAALLAVSVLVQVSGDSSKNVDVAERVDNFGTAIAENGALGDSAKTDMADWAATAESNGQMAMIRRNLEDLGYAEEIASFENVIEEFAETVIAASSGNLPSSSSKDAEPAKTSSSSMSSSSSSSSVIASEVKQSSSSSSVILSSSEGSSNNTKESYLNPKIEYGELTDTRDGQVYKTVKIGDQVWMAENLNYADSVKTPSLKGKSWCYKNDPENCKIAGRFYTWTAAIDSVKLVTDNENPQDCGYGKKCSFTSTVQGVCPDSWHLPNEAEWDALFIEVGGKSIAGEVLKSQVGWGNDNESTNEVGFSVIAAGFRRADGAFLTAEAQAHFWTVPNEDSYEFRVLEMNMYSEFDDAFWDYNYKNSGFSIRCIKDDEFIENPSSSSAESSSSSVIPASSGNLPSSSSVNLAVSCKTETEDNCEYGEIVDERDGQTYKTVKIGEQVWMAENLNYAYTSIPFKYKEDASDSTSWCYNNDASNCKKYGRLYTWATAMDSSATWSDNGKDCGYNVSYSPTYPVQGICPSGWHLPSEDEWSALLTAVGGRLNAGKVLKSQYEWNEEGNGTDEFGFTALPAGYRDDTGKFIKEGGGCVFLGCHYCS